MTSTSSEENDADSSESAKRERRRKRIIQEIINTEATYQKHLELVVKVLRRLEFLVIPVAFVGLLFYGTMYYIFCVYDV